MVSMARKLTFKELTFDRESSKGNGLGLKGFVAGVIVAAMLLGLGLSRVWTRTEIVRMAFELRKEGEAQRALILERDRLRRELAALKSPGRIEKIATVKLHMRSPAPGQIIELKKR